jgi:hypothetical protein
MKFYQNVRSEMEQLMRPPDASYEVVHEAAGVALNAAIVEAACEDGSEAVSAGLLPSYTSVRSRETDSFEVFVQLFKQLLSATYTKCHVRVCSTFQQ